MMSRRSLVNILVQKGQIPEPLYTNFQSADGWDVSVKIGEQTSRALGSTKAIAYECALEKIALPKVRARTSKLPAGIWKIHTTGECMLISFSSPTNSFEVERPATTNLYTEMWKLYNEFSCTGGSPVDSNPTGDPV